MNATLGSQTRVLRWALIAFAIAAGALSLSVPLALRDRLADLAAQRAHYGRTVHAILTLREAGQARAELIASGLGRLPALVRAQAIATVEVEQWRAGTAAPSEAGTPLPRARELAADIRGLALADTAFVRGVERGAGPAELRRLDERADEITEALIARHLGPHLELDDARMRDGIASLRDLLTRSSVALGVMALLLGASTLLTTLFLQRRIVQPVLDLAGVARQSLAGDASVRSRIARPDEIGTLSLVLDRLLESHQRHSDELQSANEDLEQRVERRTAALREAMGRLEREVESRHRAEQEARAADERLRRAQNMEAVGRLAAGIAHDFNNLLTVITGHAGLLMAGRLEPADERSSIEEIDMAAQRAAALTRQLVTFSRQQVLETRVLDVDAVVRDLLPLLRRLIGEDIRMEWRPSGRAGRVRVDPSQLTQVLLNLAVNARDAMPGGGRLEIATREEHLDEAVAARHAGARAGSYVVLRIRDTGLGMDEATRLRAFEPFFTTKVAGRGSGMGLSTVHGIVHQSGGFIDLESEPALGTTFDVYLPRVDAEAEVAQQAAGPAGAAGAGECVLVVEDEEAVRSLVVAGLRSRGYEVLEAPDGEQALALAARPGLRIDLLVTDVVLPGLRGLELADRLRRERGELRVILMSGYPAREVEGAASSWPLPTLLRKPFAAEDLARLVRAALDAPVARSAPASS